MRRWCVRLLALVACSAEDEAPQDYPRCVTTAELLRFESPQHPFFVDTTGDGVPEIWNIGDDRAAPGPTRTFGDGFLRMADGSYVETLHFDYEGALSFDFRGFGDMNGDGRQDLLLLEEGLDTQPWHHLLSDASGTPADASATDVLEGSEYIHALLDLDGDAKADLVGFDEDTGVLFVDGSTSSGRHEIALGHTYSIDISRVSGDASMFVLATRISDTNVIDVYRNAPDEVSRLVRIEIESSAVFRVVAIARSDRSLELITSRSVASEDEIVHLDVDLHNGSVEETILVPGTYNGVAGDFDGNGHLDVASRGEDPDELHVRFGLAKGAWGPPQIYPGFETDAAFQALDLDADGADALLMFMYPPEGPLGVQAVEFAACD